MTGPIICKLKGIRADYEHSHDDLAEIIDDLNEPVIILEIFSNGRVLLQRENNTWESYHMDDIHLEGELRLTRIAPLMPLQ